MRRLLVIKQIKNIIALGVLFAATSCTEIPPIVPKLGDNKVFVEEFTGIQCVNCPAGASDINDLKAIHGDRLVVVSIHAGDFAPPFPSSKFDFRTPEGNELEKLLGAPAGYPSAVVNRKRFPEKDGLQLFRSSWAGAVATETNSAAAVTLGFVKKYDPSTRALSLDVRIVPNEKIDGDVRLSIFLTEDNIKDYQETPQGRKSDYVHKFVLRKMLTKATGDNLTSPNTPSLLPKESKTARFDYKMPTNWVDKNCRIVALVHRGNPERTALQVSELKLVD